MPSASALSGRLQAGGVLVGVERVFFRGWPCVDFAMLHGLSPSTLGCCQCQTDRHQWLNKQRNGGGIARRGF